MTSYIITWEMVYEDAEDAYDAIAQAYGNLAEIIKDPSTGANYFTIRSSQDNYKTAKHITLDKALALHALTMEEL